MKYLCLIYEDETVWQTMPKAEVDKLYAEYSAFKDGIKQSGHLVVCNPLEPTQTAITVRVRNGKVSTTDGPFAETKEQLGGYFLIEARDLNDAIQVASRIPGARTGSIEVRPIREVQRRETTTSSIANDEAQIRERIDNWAQAVRVKDVKGVMSHYVADIRTFDLAPPLEYKGADAYRKNWEEWFPTFRGPIGYEIRDLGITASEDIAFCHSLNRISGTRTNGEETDVWVRATVCYRKIDGTWVVVHEHLSVPIYMDGSYKAAVDLKP